MYGGTGRPEHSAELSHTTRKEVKRNDRMDHRSVSVERDLGDHVYRVIRGSRVGVVHE